MSEQNQKIVKKILNGILYLSSIGILIFIGYSKEKRKKPTFEPNIEIWRKHIPNSSLHNADSLYLAWGKTLEIPSK